MTMIDKIKYIIKKRKVKKILIHVPYIKEFKSRLIGSKQITVEDGNLKYWVIAPIFPQKINVSEKTYYSTEKGDRIDFEIVDIEGISRYQEVGINNTPSNDYGILYSGFYKTALFYIIKKAKNSYIYIYSSKAPTKLDEISKVIGIMPESIEKNLPFDYNINVPFIRIKRSYKKSAKQLIIETKKIINKINLSTQYKKEIQK